MNRTTQRGEGTARSYRRGVVLILLGSTCASWLGLGIRFMESASAWQILAYRSVGLMVFLLAFIAIRHPGRVVATFRDTGPAGLVAALGLAAAFSGIIVAIQQASVANAMFLFAAAPFFAAVLGRLILGEPVRGATWAAIGCAFAGVGIMVAEGIGLGYLWGNVAGIVSALGLATYIIALRHGRLADMLPCNAMGGAIGLVIAIAVCVVSGTGLAVSVHDLLLSLALGAFQLGLALVLITAGSRSVPAADISLLAMTEVVLAPLWVWLILGETAGALTLAGGALLLAAIAGEAITGLRARKTEGVMR